MAILRLLAVLIFVVFAWGADGDELVDPMPASPSAPRALGTNGPVVWTMGDQSGDRVVLSVNWPGCKLQSIAEGTVFIVPDRVAGAGGGKPDLPCFATVIPGRLRHRARLSLLSKPEWTTIHDFHVAPAESLRATFVSSEAQWVKSREADHSVYQQDEFWPPLPYKVSEAWMGTQKLVRVECCLLQYNPVRKTLRFATRLKGEVVFEPSEGR